MPSIYVSAKAQNNSGTSESGTVESRPPHLRHNRGALVLDNDGPAIDWDSMIFSYQKTDRMYIAHCEQDGDWSPGVMQDFQDLSISPAAGVLNYGQGLFEGLKAQRATAVSYTHLTLPTIYSV